MEEHATSIILFESSMVNTGEPARDGKESGKEEGRPGPKARGPAGSQIGHSSLHPGKLGTPGRGLMAKALRERVGKTVQRESTNAQADPGERSVEWRNGSFLSTSLFVSRMRRKSHVRV